MREQRLLELVPAIGASCRGDDPAEVLLLAGMICSFASSGSGPAESAPGRAAAASSTSWARGPQRSAR